MKKNNQQTMRKTATITEEKQVKERKFPDKGLRICFIGSTSPDYPYQSYMGFIAGTIVTRFMLPEDLFLTGGVEGVGLDVFSGYASIKGSKPSFGVIIPSHYIYSYGINKETGESSYTEGEYNLPEEYRIISKHFGSDIHLFVRGRNMGERRKILAEESDILIAMNGGSGTLDEAITAIDKYNKPVIVMEGTGGAAHLLTLIKNGQIQYFTGNGRKRKSIPLPKVKKIENIHLVNLDNLPEKLVKLRVLSNWTRAVSIAAQEEDI